MIVLLGLAIVLGGPMSACAEKTVTFRVIGLFDLTGPYASIHSIIQKGIADFIDWANNEPGYFPEGVKWSHEIYDTGTDIGKAVAAYQMATSKSPKPVVSTGGLAAPTILAIKPLAKRKKIPCVDGSTARPIVYPPSWTFSMQAGYEGMLAASARFLKDNWRADTPYKLIRKRYLENKDRNPRISVIGWDNAFGRAFDQKETRDYLKKIGVDWVKPEYIPMSPTDTTPQILRLVERGVDMLYFGMYPNSHAFILKDAARMGVRDKFQDMAFWAGNIILLKSYAKELANESMMLTGYKMVMDEWEPAFVEMFKKRNLPDVYAFGYCAGVAWYDVYAEAIKRAVKKKGDPKKVKGEDVYNALITMTDYKPRGYNSSVTFTKTRRTGPSDACIYQDQGGKIVKIVDSIYIPDLLPGGKDVVK